MDEGPIRFRCRMDVGRDTPVADDMVFRITLLNKQEAILEGTIGGDVGRRQRIERAKRRKKMGRPGYPKPRED